MKTIAVANQKGGVGKSTTALHLASGLSRSGYRVLAVDCDPQANLTQMVGLRLDEITASLYDVLVGGKPVLPLVQRAREGFDVVPSEMGLGRAEMQLVTTFARDRKLRKALDPLRASYDYCIIDTPPNIGLLTLLALVAADGVLIPVQPEAYPIKGIAYLLETLEAVREENPALEVIGILPTLRRRIKHHDEMIVRLQNRYSTMPILDSIPEAAVFGRAALMQQTVFELDPDCAGAHAYNHLVEAVTSAAEAVRATA
ncbi:MAG: ParA family protein [Candidatus Dormibacteria bacterium]